MRLRSLTLERFGHFTDQTYDFGDAADRPDFHIIYGPNEAGKTTTMEAALRLFYGFPARDGYGFKHQRKNLQVGALLDVDGQLTRMTRVPTKGANLLDASGQPLPETAITQHLAGLSLADYRSLLCLDDETIEKGGEEIAQAKGDIGRLLFSAAAGVADLTSVLDRVQADADAIYHKAKRKTRVAELKRALIDIDRLIRDRDTTAAAWRSLKKAAADAGQAEAAAREARDALRDDLAGLERRRRALPHLAQIDALTAGLTKYSDYPARLDFDPDNLIDMVAQDQQIRADIERLTRLLDDVTETLDALPDARAGTGLPDALAALDTLHSRNTTAAMDIDRRRATVAEAEREMTQVARDLGADIDPHAAVLPTDAIDALDAARQSLRAASQTASEQAHELAVLTDSRDAAREQYDAAGAHAPAVLGIGNLLDRHDASRLAQDYAAANEAITAAEEAAAAARDALGIANEALPQCPTTPNQARDWVDRMRKLTQDLAQAIGAAVQYRADAAAGQARATVLTGDSGLMADAQVQALIEQRNKLWADHLAALDTPTAKAFAATMAQVDTALQARAARAVDLGQLRQIGQSVAEDSARAEATDATVADLRRQIEEIQSQVDTAASLAGQTAGVLPADWQDWVQRHGLAVAARDTARRISDRHQSTLDRVDALLADLAPKLDLIAPDLTAALDAARPIAAAEHKAKGAVDIAKARLDGLEADVKRRQAQADAAKRAFDTARDAWCALAARLLGDAIDPEGLLVSLAPLRELRRLEDRRSEAANRVVTMQADMEQFAQAVAALATDHAVDPADTPGETYARLQDRAEADRAHATRVKQMTAQQAQARVDLAAQQQALNELAARTHAMAAIFPPRLALDSLADLRVATRDAVRVIGDRDAVERLQRTVLTELDAGDLAQARAILSDDTLAGLEAQKDRTQSALTEAERALTAAVEARVSAAAALSQVTGDADVAQLTEQRATLELELEAAIIDHLELALGHRLADQAIRHYRDAHRGGMITETERCFAMLTDGAYTGLTTQLDAGSETLMALDAQGVSKGVADMSKGTRFQLYLALRAAAHAQMVAQGTRLPFFCDDIFETFDETRTSAACRVMEQIGRSGQAIYLTHHAHVVEIARAVCDTPPIVHHIQG